jgi:uncharacterized membrane protein
VLVQTHLVRVIVGLALVAAGVALLFTPMSRLNVETNVFEVGWPFLVIGLGLALVLWSRTVSHRAEPVAVAGGVVFGAGFVLALQHFTGDWEAWYSERYIVSADSRIARFSLRTPTAPTRLARLAVNRPKRFSNRNNSPNSPISTNSNKQTNPVRRCPARTSDDRPRGGSAGGIDAYRASIVWRKLVGSSNGYTTSGGRSGPSFGRGCSHSAGTVERSNIPATRLSPGKVTEQDESSAAR